MVRIFSLCFLLGCPSAPKVEGALNEIGESSGTSGSSSSSGSEVENDTGMSVDTGSDADADADADAEADADTDADSDSDSSEWPYAGDYTGELVISSDQWGDWCEGEAEYAVDADATLYGTAECDWEGGGGSGTVELVLNGTVGEDEGISGTAVIYIFGDSGELELQGEHTASDTLLRTGFRLGGGGGGSSDHEINVYRD